jgi:hypothetical protein
MRLFQSANPDTVAADDAARANAQAASAQAAAAQANASQANVQANAYERGRLDAASGRNTRVLMKERDAAVRQAYDRGRRDERARRPRRRGSPVLTTVLVLAAAAGVFVVYLGVSQGSFGRGGQVLDQNITNATQSATGAVHNTVDRAGDALQNAGQTLKRTAGSGG